MEKVGPVHQRTESDTVCLQCLLTENLLVGTRMPTKPVLQACLLEMKICVCVYGGGGFTKAQFVIVKHVTDLNYKTY